jgi:hypothetical protein
MMSREGNQWTGLLNNIKGLYPLVSQASKNEEKVMTRKQDIWNYME